MIWELNSNYQISKEDRKFRKKYLMWTCFKLWLRKNIFQREFDESLILVCLQIYQELLSLVTFHRVYWNSEEVSYLSWQNTYPNLKTTCHIKPKRFLWTKLLENLLLAKYFISVAETLIGHNNRNKYFFEFCRKWGKNTSSRTLFVF